MTGPGSSDTSSQSCSVEQSGVNPVVADSGSTMSSAPVAAWQRRVMSTIASRLAATEAAVSGPGAGASWTAAAVKARISVAARAGCR